MESLSRRFFIIKSGMSVVYLHLLPSVKYTNPFADHADLHPKRNTNDSPTSEEYKKYVDEAIILTKQIASGDAKLRESGLFNILVGKAQSHLSLASESISSYCTLIPYLKDLKTLQLGLSHSNIEDLLIQYHICNQMIAYHRASQNNIENFDIIYQSYEKSTPNTADYKLENIDFSFIKPNIDLPDGVFLPLFGYDPLTVGLAIAFDIFQLWFNSNEISKIEEQSRRLENEKVNLTEYRNFGSEQFIALKEEYKSYFILYKTLLAALKDWVDSAPQTELYKHYVEINKLIKNYSSELIERFNAQARLDVQNKLRPKNYFDEINIMNIKANLRIRDNLRKFDSNTSDRAAIVDELVSDMALAQLMNLSSTLRLIPEIQKAIKGTHTGSDITASTDFRIGFNLIPNYRLHSGSLNLARNPVGLYYTSDIKDIETQVEIRSFYSELKNNGPVGMEAKAGTYTNVTGGFTQYDRSSLVGYYSIEGGSKLTFSNSNSQYWPETHSSILNVFNIPGTYTFMNKSASGYKKQLDKSLASMHERKAQFESILEKFGESRKEYFSNIVNQSVNNTVADIPKLKNRVDTTLRPVLSQDINTPLNPTPIQVNELPTTNIASPPILNRSITLDSLKDDPEEFVKAIEPVWITYNGRLDSFNGVDQKSLTEIYDKYFNHNGILQEAYVPPANSLLRKYASENIKSDIHNANGKNIRKGLNKALSASSTATEQKRDAAYTGITFMIAADSASQAGNDLASVQMILVGATFIDFSLGLIPVVGSINDAIQIMHGAATGRDYAGHQMSTSDYVLRTLGVLLPLVPSKYIKIGSTVISESFVYGANLVKHLNIGAILAKTYKGIGVLAIHFTEAIHSWLPRQLASIIPPEDLAFKIMQLSEPQGRLASKIDAFVHGGVFEDYVLGVLNNLKNTDRIPSTTDAAYRIPDILNKGEKLLAEIKTTKNLTLTNQFVDYFNYCRTENLAFKLYVMEDATLSEKLIEGLKDVGAEVWTVGQKGLNRKPLP
jgi:hypothetical protein